MVVKGIGDEEEKWKKKENKTIPSPGQWLSNEDSFQENQLVNKVRVTGQSSVWPFWEDASDTGDFEDTLLPIHILAVLFFFVRSP